MRCTNRKSYQEVVKPIDWTYCSHKPDCIVTRNLARSVLITIITWHFNNNPWVWVSSIQKGNMLFEARAISRATPIVMMPLDDGNCRLTMPVVKWLCCRDPLLYTFNIGLLKCGRSNSTNSNLLPMNLWTSLKGMLLILTSTDERISLKWCKCFFMDGTVSRTRLCYTRTRNYLTSGICT